MSSDNVQQEISEQQNESKENEAKPTKRNEYVTSELQRLQKTMVREKSKIKEPRLKSHTPYTFNNLGPYLDMNTATYIVQKDKAKPPKPGYATRPTAIGLVDPWHDHSMDLLVQEPVMVPGAHARNPAPKSARGRRGEERPKEGSTHLPKYPVVVLRDQDIATKELDYGEVPQLREDIQNRYSQGSEREVEKEYVRTKQDFYRMELDKLKEVHPLNRGNLRKAYFAYLQNTPGAKKAVYECISALDEEEKREKERKSEEEEEEAEQQEEQIESRDKPREQSHDEQEQNAQDEQPEEQ